MDTLYTTMASRMRGGALRHLAAATLTVALAGAAALAVAQPGPGAGPGGAGGPHPMAMHGHGGPGMGGDGMMLPDRMLDSVGATADQKTRVRAIFQAARDDLAQQRDAGRELHQQMLSLFAAPQVDAAAVEALRQKQLARHDAASKRMMQAMLDAQAVLTPEQRQKLVERMKARQDMMQRHWRERQSIDAPKS